MIGRRAGRDAGMDDAFGLLSWNPALGWSSRWAEIKVGRGIDGCVEATADPTLLRAAVGLAAPD
jgi:hypothetical protein